MKNKSSKFLIISLIVVLVMSLGAAAAFAQTEPDEDAGAQPGFRFGHFRGNRGGNNDEALAESLGITVEELEAARQEAAAQRIEEAVEEGIITRDQANTMLAMQALKSYINKEAILADVLGLSVEELQAAKEDGTLRDILENITPADLQADTQAAFEAAIAQAVADNVITQEQADLVLSQIEDGVNLFGRGGGRHHGGGHRGFNGGEESESLETAVPFGNFQNAPAFDA